jgi:hypothetical protein
VDYGICLINPSSMSKQAIWMALLSEFDFEIKHIKGKKNRVVDALSRSMRMIHLAAMSTCETDVKNRVKKAQETDPFILKCDPVPTARTHWRKIRRLSEYRRRSAHLQR